MIWGGFLVVNRVNKGINVDTYNSINTNTDIVKSSENVRLDQSKVSNAETDNNQEGKSFSEKDFKEAVDVLNKILEKNKTHVEYERHEVFNDMMLKIIDDETGEVINEVPPKKILDMVAKLCELVGLVVDKKA